MWRQRSSNLPSALAGAVAGLAAAGASADSSETPLVRRVISVQALARHGARTPVHVHDGVDHSGHFHELPVAVCGAPVADSRHAYVRKGGGLN